jgi:hypothetical protein
LQRSLPNTVAIVSNAAGKQLDDDDEFHPEATVASSIERMEPSPVCAKRGE